MDRSVSNPHKSSLSLQPVFDSVAQRRMGSGNRVVGKMADSVQ